MKRSSRLAVTLAATLVLSLPAATSLARYVVTIGAERCCAERCPHHEHAPKGTEAEACCKAHTDVLPAAASSATADRTLQGHVLAAVAAAVPGPVAAPLAPGALARSLGPPGPLHESLLAQHTSLQV